MKPQAVVFLALTTVLTLPLTAYAQNEPQVRSESAGSAAQTRKPPVLMYECSICHHQVTAAQAKRLHFICPVDHGRLIPVKTALPSKPK